MRPSRTNPCGWKPGIPASHGSRPEYEVSMCPLNIRLGRPRTPSSRPTTFGRPRTQLRLAVERRTEAHRARSLPPEIARADFDGAQDLAPPEPERLRIGRRAALGVGRCEPARFQPRRIVGADAPPGTARGP